MREAEHLTAQRRVTIAVVTIGVFFATYFGRDGLFALLGYEPTGETSWYVRSAMAWGFILIPALLASFALFGTQGLSALGLTASPLTGLAAGTVGTLPMLLALVIWNDWSPGENWAVDAVRGAVLPGIVEEVAFRGLLFGFLFRFAGFGFFPAALLGAAVFGSAHLYQSSDPMTALGIFAVTALGGVWFAWLYATWRNLWVPIAFHLLMNLYWSLFSVADNALGSGMANASRLVVIALSVAMTVALGQRIGRAKPIRQRAFSFAKTTQP